MTLQQNTVYVIDLITVIYCFVCIYYCVSCRRLCVSVCMGECKGENAYVRLEVFMVVTMQNAYVYIYKYCKELKYLVRQATSCHFILFVTIIFIMFHNLKHVRT
jgi:hypothetical protein